MYARVYLQVWRRCCHADSTIKSVADSTIRSVDAFEKNTRDIARQGKMPKAMERTRRMLSENIMPSQDCLGTLFYACQKLRQTEFVDEILSIAEKVPEPDVALISAQISCLSVIGELERAWAIFQSSIKNNLIPRQGAVMNLSDALFNKDDVSKVLQLVETSNAKKYTVPAEISIKILSEAVIERKWNNVVWKLLEGYQHSLHLFEENIAHRLVTWFESEWGECNTERVHIQRNGSCSKCGQKLKNNNLNENEHSSLFQYSLECLEKEAAYFEDSDKETKEINSFKQYVNRTGPFGAVFDGMNVSRADGRRDTGRLMQTCYRFIDELNKPVLVVIRRHESKHFNPSMQMPLEEMRRYYAERDVHFFLTQNRVSDDKFFIYAALFHPSTFFVSNDELGDYHEVMLPSPVKGYLKKWQRNKQVFFRPSRNHLNLNFPSGFDTVLQWDNNSLHIPLVTGQWLCVEKNK